MTDQPLPRQDAAPLRNLHLRSKGIAEGFMLGLHRSPYHGFSAEFSQHRPYQFGDEIRHVDWTLYGRTDRYYIRQFQEETNLNAMICLDNSASMSFGSGSYTKFQFASLLASALAYVLIRQNDAAGLCIFNETVDEFIRPRAVQSRYSLITESLQKCRVSSGTDISSALHSIADKMHKRGLIILISDLWDDPESIFSGLKHLKFQKQELIVFQVADPFELDLQIRDTAAFVDMETGEEIKADTRKISAEYSRLMNDRVTFFRKAFGEAAIDHVLMITDNPPEYALREYLIKRKKLH